LLLSLLLHATGIAGLSLALPRLNVRPGVLREVEFAVLSKPEPEPELGLRGPKAAAQPARPDEPMSAAVAVEVTENPGASIALRPARAATPAPVAAPKPARKAPTKPLTAAPPAQQLAAAPPTASTPSKLPSATHADARSDGSALERVLRKIASTSELTQDERRRAMLIVLRTWEDPSGKHSAEELVDALIQGVRKAQTRPVVDAGTK
jgi:hypothetical protein